MPLIGDASGVYLGTTPVDAIYARNEKVWPTGPVQTPVGPLWKTEPIDGSATIVQYDSTQTGWAAIWNGTILEVTIPIPKFSGGLFTSWANIYWPAVISQHPYGIDPLPISSGYNHQHWMERIGFPLTYEHNTKVIWTPDPTNMSMTPSEEAHGVAYFYYNYGSIPDTQWKMPVPEFNIDGYNVTPNRYMPQGYWCLWIRITASIASTGGQYLLDTSKTSWQFVTEV